MKKSRMICFLILSLVLVAALLTGCGGGGGIEGTWVLAEEHFSDGTKMRSKELAEEGISEKYEISGSTAKYTCEVALIGKPIEIEFAVEDLGDNRYNLQMEGGFIFATVEVKGNTMTYTVGEEDKTEMVFKRQ